MSECPHFEVGIPARLPTRPPSAAVDAKILSDEVTTLLQTNANTQYHEFYDPFIATPEAGVNFYSVDSTSGTNVYFRRRCGYRPCPSWSEWRSAYEKGTWGYEKQYQKKLNIVTCIFL